MITTTMAETVDFTACMVVGCVGFNAWTCKHAKLHGGVETMVSLQDVPFVCFNAYMANMKNCGPRYGVDAVGADMIVMYELSCMKFKY